MKLEFSPVRSEAVLTASVSGDVLTVNGEAFDFSALPEGATLPRDAVLGDWLASDVERRAGEVCLTLFLPHGSNPPPETAFPAAVVVSGGPVPVPAPDLSGGSE